MCICVCIYECKNILTEFNDGHGSNAAFFRVVDCTRGCAELGSYINLLQSDVGYGRFHTKNYSKNLSYAYRSNNSLGYNGNLIGLSASPVFGSTVGFSDTVAYGKVDFTNGISNKFKNGY